MTEDIRKKIVKWLREEGITWQNIADPNAEFNFSCNYPPEQHDHINIVKPQDKDDIILIVTGIAPDGAHPEKMRSADQITRQRFSSDIKYEFLRMLLDFNVNEDENYNIESIQISRSVFYENIDKEYFMEKVKSVYFGKIMVRLKLVDIFGSSKGTGTGDSSSSIYG